MSSVFGRGGLIEKTNQRLNKHVHKQGYDEFYTIRNSIMGGTRYSNEELAEEYIRLFKNSLTIVLVMRLSLDPFSILLLEPEIDCRCPDLEE